ncbi:MAG: short-chain dehydrogenase, partial [Chloroflexi bacterium]|nr:short-chain dehydrogenase [Chloroflexota bacterium]
FTYELQRRLEAVGARTITNAAHPGFTLTGLQHRAANESDSSIERFIYGVIVRRLGNTLEMGTLALLRAGTDPDAKAAAFYGPRRFMVRGYPVTHGSPKAAHDTDVARRLWEVSEQLTGVTALERQPEHA